MKTKNIGWNGTDIEASILAKCYDRQSGLYGCTVKVVSVDSKGYAEVEVLKATRKANGSHGWAKGNRTTIGAWWLEAKGGAQ